MAKIGETMPDPTALDGIKMKVAEISDAIIDWAEADDFVQQWLCSATGMTIDELREIRKKCKAYLGDT